MHDVATRQTWTDDRIELLKKLYADNLSASQIADELGGNLSRNAVIGKLHRLGLMGRKRAHSIVNVAKSIRKAPAGIIRNATKIVAKAQGRYRAPELHPDTITDLPADQSDCAVKMMDANEAHCRWPIGGEPTADMLVCGAKPIKGMSYCARHCRIAYRSAA